jgi:NADPH:quinone reductase-like Zn-dependent oxidoreductase
LFEVIAETVAESTQIPSDISTDAAASVPLGLMTAALAMYNEGSDSLGLTPPWVAGGKNKYADQPFVVCAASTSVGQFGTCAPTAAPTHVHSCARLSVVQLAKLSGFSPIIATASPANFALVKALGATHVVDRKLIGSLGAEIAKVTSAPVAHAYDAWSDAETQQTLLDLLAPRGRLALVLPPLVAAHDGKTLFFVQGSVHLPTNRALGVSIFGALEGLLADGSIKVSLRCWRIVTWCSSADSEHAAERRGGAAGRLGGHCRRAGADGG